jgi:tRNA-Thr(GGU) m(6)t(6)A37 methyltransferase TsaA
VSFGNGTDIAADRAGAVDTLNGSWLASKALRRTAVSMESCPSNTKAMTMTDTPTDKRPGEMVLAFDPARIADDARLRFIGRLRSPWSRGNCPKNLRQARELGGIFRAELDEPFRPGLAGLQAGQAVILIYWTGSARRDLIVQTPAHREVPTGVFALRSPARPNPIAVAVVRILAIDPATGLLAVDALDAFDGTPLLDLKPWLTSVDVPPAAE